MVDVVKSCIESDKEGLSCDDLILPGFRFHPTDEELVGFYLRRKLQLRPLPVELIKQVDIYKYEPWDLPKLASTGEKEWYFYCPRDRKYRNSNRPNRVTGSGFWKATGTDRPIYSSDGSKCIGLKKSLVFYRGRAARGVKTDWMMHEFRLPTEATAKNLPPNDSWAICRIFKKANSAVNRALLAQSWQTPSTTSPDGPYISSTNHDFQHPGNFSAALKASPILTSPDNNNNDYFRETTADFTSMILNLSPGLGLVDSKSTELQMQLNGHSNNSSNTLSANINMENHQIIANSIRSMDFPFSLSTGPQDSWDSPPCPSEISSTNYSADKYYP